MRKKYFYSHPHGFTLIELMITVAIIGILSAIAYPSYVQYNIKTRRAEAAGILQEAAMYMERMYGQTRSYKDIALPTDLTQSPKPPNSRIFYVLTLVAAPRTFTITAAPQQALQPDTDCGSLSIDQDGNKTAMSKKSSETQDQANSRCWGQ